MKTPHLTEQINILERYEKSGYISKIEKEKLNEFRKIREIIEALSL